MNIFQHGIHWDPREPLPEDYIPKDGSNRTEAKRRKVGSPPQIIAFQSGDQHIYPPSLDPGPSQPPIPQSGPPIRNVSKPIVSSTNPVPYLAPLSLAVQGTILQDRAAMTVVQIFETPTSDTISQARYSFPLPNECTVTGFSCRFGADRVLKAKVTPREKAKEAFNEAVRDKRGAALLEEITTEVFMASLGNLPANTRIKTEIRYIVTLKTEFSADKTFYNFLMPTGIAPRYGERPVEIPAQTMTPGKVSLDLEVMDAEHSTITCSSHPIAVQVVDQHQSALQLEDLANVDSSAVFNIKHVKLSDERGFDDCDLLLSIQSESAPVKARCHAFGEKHSTYENQLAFMIDIPRSSLPLPHQPASFGEVIFLADRSGSMSDKMDALKSSLRFFLKGIPIGWAFNLWSFGSHYEYLWPVSRPYNAETLQEALEYLEGSFEANLGGTELLQAITALTETRSRSNTSPCEIIILTDGEVWRLDETLQFVDKARNLSQGAIRLFALGIGSHVSAALVDGIARYGGGYSDIVRQTEDQPWEDRVVKMLDAAISTRQDCSISLQVGDGFQIQNQSPKQLGVINTPFQSSKVFLLVSQQQTTMRPTEITIEFKDSSNSRSYQAVVMPITWKDSENDMIHALAARACISELDLAQEASTHPGATADSITTDGMPSSVRDESMVAQEMACKYSLLSKWTSLFLEYERSHDNTSGLLTGICNASESTNRVTNLYKARHPSMAYITSSKSRKRCRASTLDPEEMALSCMNGVSDGRVVFDVLQNFSPESPGSNYNLSHGETNTTSERNLDFVFQNSEISFDPFSSEFMIGEECGLSSQVEDLVGLFSSEKSPEGFPKESGGTHDSSFGETLWPEFAADIGSEVDPSKGREPRFTTPIEEGETISLISTDDGTRPSSDEGTDDKQASDQVPEDRRAITDILNRQRFDGSVDGNVLNILGKEAEQVTKALEELLLDRGAGATNMEARNVAIVMITIAVLHEDHANMAELWKLIASKAQAYVVREVGKLIEYEWMESEARRLLREFRAKNESESQGDVRTGKGADEEHYGGNERESQQEWIELDTAPF